MARSGTTRAPASRPAHRFAVVVAAVTIAALMGAAPAHAASYRYWSYWWVQDGTWTFATTGPASSIPADGAVEGWHFGITSESGGDPPGIDAAGAFDQACGSTPAEPGSKRVALAIDPGEPDDAPDGEAPGSASLSCVVIEEDSNGYQVLRSQAQVRTEAGLICAIAGYPTVGCADIVEARTAAPSAAEARQQGPDAPTAANAGRGDSTGANALPLVVAGLAIGALAGFAWRRRRRP